MQVEHFKSLSFLEQREPELIHRTGKAGQGPTQRQSLPFRRCPVTLSPRVPDRYHRLAVDLYGSPNNSR